MALEHRLRRTTLHLTGSIFTNTSSTDTNDALPAEVVSAATSRTRAMSLARAGTRWGFMQSRMYDRTGTHCGSMLRMPADNFK